ncbi:MAG: hypothetical protein WAN89_07615 [Lawsonella sp.]|nr:hypothetical protein [Mycobacteriales bacterium]
MATARNEHEEVLEPLGKVAGLTADLRDEIAQSIQSGRSLVLHNKNYVALIDRRGAALQGLWWRDKEDATALPLAEPYGQESPYTCGQTLVPWPNRIEDAHFIFRNTLVHLEMTEPDLDNAIHGLATDVVWTVSERAADNSFATLLYSHSPASGTGWPWEFIASVRYEVTAEGLVVSAGVENKSRSAMPWGYGAHPYITAGGADLDESTLLAQVDDWWVTTDRNLPTGEMHPVGEGTPEINRQCLMKDVWFDTPFTVSTLAPIHDGWQELARLTAEVDDNKKLAVVMEADGEFPWLQIFTTGEKTVPFPGKGRALAVEPMTCPPNAMVSGQDVIVVEPGLGWTGKWRLRADA